MSILNGSAGRIFLNSDFEPPDVEPPFSPIDIAGLQLWLDSSDGTTITADGSNNVSEWRDKTANNNDFTQVAGANQPLWDGSSKITFDGVSEYLSGASSLVSALDGNSEGFIAYTVNHDSGSVGDPKPYFALNESSGTARRVYAGISKSGSNYQAIFQIRDGTKYHAKSDSNISDGDTVVWTQDGAALKLYINGVESTFNNDGNTAVGSNWIGTISGGLLDSAKVGATHAGSIVSQSVEVSNLLVGTSSISASEASDIHNYLNS